jgi:hypothetical protein
VLVLEIVPAAETGPLHSAHSGRKPRPHLNSVRQRNNGRLIRAANQGGGTKPGGTQEEGIEAAETKPVAAETVAGPAAKAGGTKVGGTSQEDNNGSSQRNLNRRRSRIQTVEATRALPGSGGLLSFLIIPDVSEPEHGLLSY